MAYLTVSELPTYVVVPTSHIDQCESVAPGFVDAQLAYWSGYIDSRLRKRYKVPFADPAPIAVKGWLARIVTVRLETRIGIRPTDEQFAWIEADAKGAFTELDEAANAETGLFDLPMHDDEQASGLGTTGTLVYSEQSPYVGFDVQRHRGRSEDQGGNGTTR